MQNAVVCHQVDWYQSDWTGLGNRAASWHSASAQSCCQWSLDMPCGLHSSCCKETISREEKSLEVAPGNSAANAYSEKELALLGSVIGSTCSRYFLAGS